MLKIIRITSKSVEDVIKIKFGDLHLMNPHHISDFIKPKLEVQPWLSLLPRQISNVLILSPMTTFFAKKVS